MILEHYRYNTDCDVWEELEPLDQNLNYDFNYQQNIHLPQERVVLPVSIYYITLLLSVYSCVTYNTSRREIL